MGCKIANNKMIRKLKREMGIKDKCHSRRKVCIMNKISIDKNHSLGIQGAILGYCQGLINKKNNDPEFHTKFIINSLNEIGAILPKSHELFLELKPDGLSIQKYLDAAMLPLNKTGRVPILITRYRPSIHKCEIEKILASNPSLAENDTMLYRVSLENKSDFDEAAKLVNKFYTSAIRDKKIPKWLPLLQSIPKVSVEFWEYYKNTYPLEWIYTVIAINPFSVNLIDLYSENIIVVQWIVGKVNEISENGFVSLHTDNCINGNSGFNYNIYDYTEKIKALDIANLSHIVCGSAEETWNLEINKLRIKQYLPFLESCLKALWGNDLFNRINHLDS